MPHNRQQWTPPKPGTAVAITAGRLGLLADPEDHQFVDDATVGEYATYHGPHPNPELADKGWDLLRVERGGRTLWCPAHDTQYQPL